MNQLHPIMIHTDPSLLVLSKPAGVLSIPDGYNPDIPNLRQILEPIYGRLWVVHRLDKNTSGMMVMARNADIHTQLNTQFAEHKVKKTYHAIIQGNPDWHEKTLEAPLRSNVGRRKRTTVDYSRGKYALTRFEVLEHYSGFCLICIQPETGRTHQIRAHLYNLGYNILSDPLYGTGISSPFISRIALHACSLTFHHPQSQQICTYSAPYPSDFEHALSQLQ
jgi:RluA family pseudouridine synthase